MKVACIGYRNHAERLLKLVEEHPDCTLSCVYHPTKQLEHPLATNDFSKITEADAIIIASPSGTHADYLRKLLKFPGYIFCEKPPVTTISDLKDLESWELSLRQRTYFNFNTRFGALAKALNNDEYRRHLGKIMHISISVTHGLAFKDVYKNSWRADGEKHKHAITETVAIHYIDLMRFTFGEVLKSQYAPLIVAKNGTAFDTSHVALQFRNGSASIFTSYAAPYTNRATVFGTDGVMEIIEDKLTIRAPRDTFSETGSFASPPVQIETALNSIDEYQQSLKESFCFFVEHAKVKKPLNPEGYKVSVETNRFLLELHTHNV